MEEYPCTSIAFTYLFYTVFKFSNYSVCWNGIPTARRARHLHRSYQHIRQFPDPNMISIHCSLVQSNAGVSIGYKARTVGGSVRNLYPSTSNRSLQSQAKCASDSERAYFRFNIDCVPHSMRYSVLINHEGDRIVKIRRLCFDVERESIKS